MTKRVFDAAAAGLGLVLLSPLLACMAALILRDVGRPVLFCQLRPGLGGRPFRLVKFRTMRQAVGAALTDEVRLTRFGRFLRSTSLDELPQLWNVLKGEMSLVGPRPLLMEYLPLYSAEEARRHSVRPGMTGWAQVHGRNALSWDEKLALDLWYVDNRSFCLDLRVLGLTLASALRRGGINAAGHATMPRFRGTE